MHERLIIGWNEWCGLPELAIPAIKAKIDTGARTSALHALDIERFKRDGQDFVRFIVQPLPTRKKLKFLCETPLLDYRAVTSSNGQQQKRCVIQTMLTMDSVQWPIQMTLASRKNMRFHMLLGREALASRVLIDPRRAHVLGRCSKQDLNRLYATT